MVRVLTVATANVNGIRAAFKRGMGEWIDRRCPDVLLVQEVRAPDEVLRDHLPPGTWHLAHEASEIKGRAGVAIAARLPMSAIRIGIGTGIPVDSGRWVEADLELPGADGADGVEGAAPRTLTVVSAYVHSGQVDTPKMEQKYAFLDVMTKRMAELAGSGHEVIIAGDLNIAHREVDIKNWRGNRKAAGFLPEERAYLDQWFDEQGWRDLGREHGGDGPGPYTWWSWRGQAFDNDSGWRIDYQLATPGLADRVRRVEVDRAATYDARFSDHAPVIVDYDV